MTYAWSWGAQTSASKRYCRLQIRCPLSGTVTLTFVLAVWFVASGLVSLATAAQRGSAVPGRAMMFFSGVLAVLLGILIAVELPSSAAWRSACLSGST
jgi:uncharacterized membrane protein HdeD (DUF308 family)